MNHFYSAYAMVGKARAMVRSGEIGKVRVVVTNFSHGHHGDPNDADKPAGLLALVIRRWPAFQVSLQIAVSTQCTWPSFICNGEVEKFPADFAIDYFQLHRWKTTR